MIGRATEGGQQCPLPGLLVGQVAASAGTRKRPFEGCSVGASAARRWWSRTDSNSGRESGVHIGPFEGKTSRYRRWPWAGRRLRVADQQWIQEVPIDSLQNKKQAGQGA